MSYPNREKFYKLYCPATDKIITYRIVSHYNSECIFASHNLSYECIDSCRCPFTFCKAEYDEYEHKLIVRK